MLPPPVPPPPPSAAPAYVPRPMNGMAVASLCCSVGTLFVGFSCILGIVFGHVALAQLRRDPSQEGFGLAVAGLVVGYVFLAIGVLVVALVVAVFWNGGR